MTTTFVKSGDIITVTSTEKQIDVNGPIDSRTPALTLELISGSYQYTTAHKNSPPVINTAQSTLSTANDKKLVTIEPGNILLRVKGSGVLHISY